MLHVWNIYRHLPQKSPSSVGKYTSTMVRIWVGKKVEPTPLKNDGVRQIRSSSQLLGKIKAMFQTTNQIMAQ